MTTTLTVPVFWRILPTEFLRLGHVAWPFEHTERGFIPHPSAALRKYPVGWDRAPLLPVDYDAEQTITYREIVKRLEVIRRGEHGDRTDCIVLDDPHELDGYSGFNPNLTHAALPPKEY